MSVVDPPRCAAMGSYCRQIPVRMVICPPDTDRREADHLATWLTGHTGRLDFGEISWRAEGLVVDAVLHAPCAFLRDSPGGAAECVGFGYCDSSETVERVAASRVRGNRTYELVEDAAIRELQLSELSTDSAERAHPNPCAGVACVAGDRSTGSACCREMAIYILCDETDTGLLQLLMSRDSSVVSRVVRYSPGVLQAQLISACSYLGPRGDCTLYGRARPDGLPAWPSICQRWPLTADEVRNPRCIFHRASELESNKNRWNQALGSLPLTVR